ncbi:PEP-CTERM sorting domain-containing protein [Aquincola sp. J276]|uniref:PEP-CTERM sorting domain-containing protein n=1 Tax=Aquincola sp. J276 TaxID=2898432 RepID=UPI002151B2CB|nr:PEP-CTERM sorting domain-containing protein [Aquincola sp. J276]MCR5864080.1 hypothetical protein [Aquincola sp. J276]
MHKSLPFKRLSACAALVICSTQAPAAIISTRPPSILVPAGLVDPLSSLNSGLPSGYFLVPVNFTVATGLDTWTFDLRYDFTVAAPADLGGLFQNAYQALSGDAVSQILSSGVASPGLLHDVSGFFEQPQDGSGSLAYLLFAWSPGQEGTDPGVRVVDGPPSTAVPEPASLFLALFALVPLVITLVRRQRHHLVSGRTPA